MVACKALKPHRNRASCTHPLGGRKIGQMAKLSDLTEVLLLPPARRKLARRRPKTSRPPSEIAAPSIRRKLARKKPRVRQSLKKAA